MTFFPVDGSDVGKGSIEIEINEGLVKVGAVQQNPNNKRVYDVIFTPDRQGQYYVNIKYKDQLVAGRPDGNRSRLADSFDTIWLMIYVFLF